jgi:hypothetical protein
MRHRDVIDLWDTHQSLADLLGVSRPLITQMRTRDHIPSKYWAVIVESKPREVDLRVLADHVRVDR